MNWKVVGVRPDKKSMFIKTIHHLDIRKTPDAGRERSPYLVTINMMREFTFQFDPETEKFFTDEENVEEGKKELEEVNKEIESMEETEKDEYLQWRLTKYIDKQEYVLFSDDNIIEKIKEIIKSL